MNISFKLGIILVILIFSGCLSSDKTKPIENKTNSVQSGTNSENYTDFQKMFKYPSSEKVEFTVTAEEKYMFGEPIEMTLKWLNKSQDNQVIMIRDYWDHPIGIGASIINTKTNDTLQKYTSRHILSSDFFLENELKKYEISLKPNENKTHTIHLNEIPYFENNNLNLSKKLPRGTYTAQINYYAKSSNELKFIIE